MIPQPITIHGKTGVVMYLNDLWHPVSAEDATMARVLFDDGSTGFYVTQPVQSVAKYDPSQPRHPEGSSEGGQFAETGRSGHATPDPELAKQAQQGIAEVERLLPKAIKTARYTNVRTSWSDLNEEAREKVFQKYVEEQYEFTDDQTYTDDIDEKFRNDLQNDPVRQEQLTKDTEKQFRSFMKDQADPASVGRDLTTLKHPDGTDFTLDEKAHAAVIWHAAYNNLEQDALLEYKNSDEYFQKRKEVVMKSLREQWAGTSQEAKVTLATEMRIRGELSGVVAEMHEPLKWVTGVEKGDHNDNNYALTHAIAARLTELRFDELRAERKEDAELPTYSIAQEGSSKNFVIRDENDIPVGSAFTKEQAEIDAAVWAVKEQANRTQSASQIIEGTWHAWKQSSSEGLGLSLQLAAAYELGGHHRMTRYEVEQAEEDAKEVGGMGVLQAYVRAQWEVTQMVMKKAGEDNISVYRGLMLEGDRVKGTTNLIVDKDGKPVPAPTNIKTGLKSLPSTTGSTFPNAETREYVSFDFNNEHFVVEKNQIPATDIRVLAEQVRTNPRTWYDVGQDVKDQVRAQWKKVWDENKAATKDLTPEKSDELQEKLFQRLGDDGRFQLMHEYAQQGHVTLPKPMTLPLETNEEAIQRRIQTYVGIESTRGKVFTKLPDIKLRRAGAQSTTGTASVANDWNGVGTQPDHPTRVVLRVEAPATSVLSLPVYGQNSQEEHETVLMGTTDKWLWDAWRHKAPLFNNISITGKAVPKKPLPEGMIVMWPNDALDYDSLNKASKSDSLVIDLQAEDRGKPHWMSGTTVPEGLGGITRKFDESQHPRGEDGRFKEATSPRIFNRPSDVSEIKGWPGDPTRFGWKDPKTGEATGMLLTGEPIARENIPPKLYHVTTNAPAVESSGVLLGQRGDTGLGGGQAAGVSFTASREDATVIQRELQRAVRIARGELTIDAIERFAREDEKEAGLPEGALKDAVTFAVESSYRSNEFTLNNTFVWDKDLPEDKRGYVGPPHPPEERERLRRGLMKDAFNAYLQLREETAAKALGQKEWPYSVPLLKNPILFGRQEHLAKLSVGNIRTLEVSSEQIPLEALVTTGSDKFLHEVRVYSDVPMRRKNATLKDDHGTTHKWEESQHPRDTEGKFTETGAKATQPVTGAGGSGGVAVPKAPGRPDAVPEAHNVANSYNAAHGFPPVKHGYATVDEAVGGEIADLYDALPVDDSSNPVVKEAYEALSQEIQAQWDHIIASGVQMVPWTKEGQPYQTSSEMAADVRDNKRLYFFTGGDPHPLLGAIDPKTGLSMNDKFRAVHDYFGHAAGGYGFGARGEENAWLSHSQMLSPKARRALTTETRAQNSWVNYGAHNYNADGTYKNLPPAERPYAKQKVALLPDRYVFP